MIVSPTSAGIVLLKSNNSFEATWRLLNNAIEANPASKIVSFVDHAENARKAGQVLRPTRLVIFGNPQIGTPLITSSQTAALDLPQKMIVFEDEKGNVFIAYTDPVYIAKRHGGAENNPALKTTAIGLDYLAKVATTKGKE